MSLPSSRTYGGWLALVRILTGAIWLIHGVPKFMHSDALYAAERRLRKLRAARDRDDDRFVSRLSCRVSSQPNATVFAELVRLGEVCVGISLVLGLLTRFGGFVGIVLPLNYLAARGGFGSASEWASMDGCMMLLSAISFVLPTGRVAGFDALFSRRSPRRQVVVPEIVPERPLDGPTAPR